MDVNVKIEKKKKVVTKKRIADHLNGSTNNMSQRDFSEVSFVQHAHFYVYVL